MARRRTGRVARLAAKARLKVNEMIHDGLEYREIIERMGKAGVGLKPDNLIEWRKGGHQEWLRGRERLEHMSGIREFALKMVRKNKGKAIEEAGLQMAATHIYELLMEFDREKLKEKLRAKPEFYPQLVNVLTRLSAGGLKHERHRAEVAKEKTKLEKGSAGEGKGGVSKEALDDFRRALKLL